MIVTDDAIESVAGHSGVVEGVVPPQDGELVNAGKKKKKKKKTRQAPVTTELPPLRLPPNTTLELHELSGTHYMSSRVHLDITHAMMQACTVS